MTAAQNEVTRNNHIVRRLYFQAVTFVTTIMIIIKDLTFGSDVIIKKTYG